MRSFWKIGYIHFYLLRNFLRKGLLMFEEVPFLWKSRGILLDYMIGQKIMLYRGNVFMKLVVTEEKLYHYLGEFVLSKRIGSIIHKTLKNKNVRRQKKDYKKSKGFRLNVIGLRLNYFTSWEDVWYGNYYSYPFMLHKVYIIRRYLNWYFRNFYKIDRNLMLSHYNIKLYDFQSNLSVVIYVLDCVFEYKINEVLSLNIGKLKNYLKYILICMKNTLIYKIDQFSMWYSLYKCMIRKLVLVYKNLLKLIKLIEINKNLSSYFFKIKRINRLYILPNGKSFSSQNDLKVYLIKKVNKQIIYINACISQFRQISIFLENRLFQWKTQLLHYKIKGQSSLFKYARTMFLNIYRNFRYEYFKFELMYFFSKFGIFESTVHFIGIRNNSITSQFLCRYICNKLRNKFTIQEFIKPICVELKYMVSSLKGFFGWKIKLKGRFQRRNRARAYIFSGGTMPLTSTTEYIDYSIINLPMKNSLCSIRVWFHRKKERMKNFTYKIC